MSKEEPRPRRRSLRLAEQAARQAISLSNQQTPKKRLTGSKRSARDAGLGETAPPSAKKLRVSTALEITPGATEHAEHEMKEGSAKSSKKRLSSRSKLLLTSPLLMEDTAELDCDSDNDVVFGLDGDTPIGELVESQRLSKQVDTGVMEDVDMEEVNEESSTVEDERNMNEDDDSKMEQVSGVSSEEKLESSPELGIYIMSVKGIWMRAILGQYEELQLPPKRVENRSGKNISAQALGKQNAWVALQVPLAKQKKIVEKNGKDEVDVRPQVEQVLLEKSNKSSDELWQEEKKFIENYGGKVVAFCQLRDAPEESKKNHKPWWDFPFKTDRHLEIENLIVLEPDQAVGDVKGVTGVQGVVDETVHEKLKLVLQDALMLQEEFNNALEKEVSAEAGGSVNLLLENDVDEDGDVVMNVNQLGSGIGIPPRPGVRPSERLNQVIDQESLRKAHRRKKFMNNHVALMRKIRKIKNLQPEEAKKEYMESHARYCADQNIYNSEKTVHILLSRPELWWWEKCAAEHVEKLRKKREAGQYMDFFYLYECAFGKVLRGLEESKMCPENVGAANLLYMIQTALGRTKIQVTPTHMEEAIVSSIVIGDASVGKSHYSTVSVDAAIAGQSLFKLEFNHLENDKMDMEHEPCISKARSTPSRVSQHTAASHEIHHGHHDEPQGFVSTYELQTSKSEGLAMLNSAFRCDGVPREFVNKESTSELRKPVMTVLANFQPTTCKENLEGLISTGFVPRLMHFYVIGDGKPVFNGAVFKDSDVNSEKSFALLHFQKSIYNHVMRRYFAFSLLHSKHDWNIMEPSTLGEGLLYKFYKVLSIAACYHAKADDHAMASMLYKARDLGARVVCHLAAFNQAAEQLRKDTFNFNWSCRTREEIEEFPATIRVTDVSTFFGAFELCMQHIWGYGKMWKNWTHSGWPRFHMLKKAIELPYDGKRKDALLSEGIYAHLPVFTDSIKEAYEKAKKAAQGEEKKNASRGDEYTNKDKLHAIAAWLVKRPGKFIHPTGVGRQSTVWSKKGGMGNFLADLGLSKLNPAPLQNIFVLLHRLKLVRSVNNTGVVQHTNLIVKAHPGRGGAENPCEALTDEQKTNLKTIGVSLADYQAAYDYVLPSHAMEDIEVKQRKEIFSFRRNMSRTCGKKNGWKTSKELEEKTFRQLEKLAENIEKGEIKCDDLFIENNQVDDVWKRNNLNEYIRSTDCDFEDFQAEFEGKDSEHEEGKETNEQDGEGKDSEREEAKETNEQVDEEEEKGEQEMLQELQSPRRPDGKVGKEEKEEGDNLGTGVHNIEMGGSFVGGTFDSSSLLFSALESSSILESSILDQEQQEEQKQEWLRTCTIKDVADLYTTKCNVFEHMANEVINEQKLNLTQAILEKIDKRILGNVLFGYSEAFGQEFFDKVNPNLFGKGFRKDEMKPPSSTGIDLKKLASETCSIIPEINDQLEQRGRPEKWNYVVDRNPKLQALFKKLKEPEGRQVK